MKRLLQPTAVVAVAFACCAALASPLLAGGRILAVADGLRETYPGFAGPWRLWNPDMLLGYAPYADPSLATFYPLRLLRDVPGGFDAYVLLGYAICAAAAFGYALEVTRDRVAAGVAAVAFACGGFAIGQFGHPMIVQPAAWSIVALWAVARYLTTRGRGWLAAIAAAIAIGCTAGQPQITLFAIVLLPAYAAFVSIDPRRPLRSLAPAGATIAAIALGVGMGAVAIVPAIALAVASSRSTLSFAAFKVYALPLDHVARALALPFAAGGGSASVYPPSVLESPAVPFVETSPYVAATALALAVAGVFARPRRIAAFWSIVALAGVALAVGEALPLAAWTYAVPPFNRFRVPGRHAYEFTLAVAMLASLGLASLGSALTSRARVAGGLVVVALVVSDAIADVASRVPHVGDVPSVTTFVAIDAVQAILALAALAAPLAPRVRRAVLAGAVTLGAVAFAATSYARDAPPWTTVVPPQPYASALLRLPIGVGQRVYTFGATPQERLQPNLPQAWLLPDLAGYTPLERERTRTFLRASFEGELLDPDARAIDLAAIRYVAIAAPAGERLSDAAPFSAIPLHFVIGGDDAPRALALTTTAPVDADRIALVTSLASAAPLPAGEPVAELTVRDARDATHRYVLRAGVETAAGIDLIRPDRSARATSASVFAVEPIGTWYVASVALGRTAAIRSVTLRALARVRLYVRNVSLVDDRSHRAVAMAADAAYRDPARYRATGTYDGVDVFENRRASPRAWTDDGPATIVTLAPERRAYDTSCARRCTLVSSDAWDAEWTAAIDGRPATLFARPGILESVRVPAGRHRVTFAYRPRTLELGVAIAIASLAALVAWLAVGAAARRRQRSRAASIAASGTAKT